MNTAEYLKLAEVEDSLWYFQSLHGHIERELAKALPVGPMKVLDAGCGTGGLILRMRQGKPERQFTGIDFSALACTLAQERLGPDVEIKEASVTDLPFTEGQFDAVVSADVLCQIERPAEAMAEFFRVLRPGGVAIINVPAYMWMWSYHDDSCQSKHRFTRPEMRALVQQTGGKLLRLTHWNSLLFPLIWAKRKLLPSPATSSDVKAYPPALAAGINGLMAIEHAWLWTGANWGWGSSVFLAAQKPWTMAHRPVQNGRGTTHEPRNGL